MKYIVNLNEVDSSDIASVGGKNASIGEMIQKLASKGINVPDGFATTVYAYQEFLAQNNLEKKITKIINTLNFNNLKALNKASSQIRRWILTTPFLPDFEKEVTECYAPLKNKAVAVRSSATTEDLVDSSFAGQQDTFLNVKGLKNVLQAIKLVYASLFTSRAMAYRHHRNFDHISAALSVGIQPMVRSDKGTSGVIFTLDTESGFEKVILITASYGLGETIVQGQVNPDEYYVFKPTLEAKKFSILQRKLGNKAIKMVYTSSKQLQSSTKIVDVKPIEKKRFCLDDQDIQILAQQALVIEKHYGRPMDIEWAKDGITGQIYILQARPETVKSQSGEKQKIKHFTLSKKGKVISIGHSIGQHIGQGVARLVNDPKNTSALSSNEVLVTDMTDPDWEPIMKNAAAIVTNRGGRTCHAAIVARELGIPAIVGCNDATKKIKENKEITVSCAEGQTGYIYEGRLPFNVKEISVQELPALPVKLCINLGNPDKAFSTQFLPNDGVGLARLEFIISHLGIHPNACLGFDKLSKKLKKQISEKTSAYANPVEYYVEKLREGIATIAAAFFPKQVIFRFSDFKSNEYANLLGGNLFEPHEENPMLGFRGASRYKDPSFEACFALECQAIKRVREEMGLVNAQVMVPFVRTINELKEIINVIEKNGLKRGKNDLKIYMMCEIPSNALLAHEFLEHVDGFSVGSNDLTQLTLGLDRDSNLVASLFDERDSAVKLLLHKAISECNKQEKYISICGQGPSDHPDFAEWLMQEGIDSISLNPDSIIETWLKLAEKQSEKSAESFNLVGQPEMISDINS